MCLQIFQRKRGLRNPAKIGDARSFCRRGCSVGHYYDLEDAQQLDYIAYTGRHPFTTDAYQLGFLPGFRENGSYQDTTYSNVDVPIGFLDNDFSNPDLWIDPSGSIHQWRAVEAAGLYSVSRAPCFAFTRLR